MSMDGSTATSNTTMSDSVGAGPAGGGGGGTAAGSKRRGGRDDYSGELDAREVANGFGMGMSSKVMIRMYTRRLYVLYVVDPGEISRIADCKSEKRKLMPVPSRKRKVQGCVEIEGTPGSGGYSVGILFTNYTEVCTENSGIFQEGIGPCSEQFDMVREGFHR